MGIRRFPDGDRADQKSDQTLDQTGQILKIDRGWVVPRRRWALGGRPNAGPNRRPDLENRLGLGGSQMQMGIGRTKRRTERWAKRQARKIGGGGRTECSTRRWTKQEARIQGAGFMV